MLVIAHYLPLGERIGKAFTQQKFVLNQAEGYTAVSNKNEQLQQLIMIAFSNIPQKFR